MRCERQRVKLGVSADRHGVEVCLQRDNTESNPRRVTVVTNIGHDSPVLRCLPGMQWTMRSTGKKLHLSHRSSYQTLMSVYLDLLFIATLTPLFLRHFSTVLPTLLHCPSDTSPLSFRHFSTFPLVLPTLLRVPSCPFFTMD